MSTEERLINDLKDAMRAGAAGEVRKSTIRMARSAIHNAQIALGHPLNEEEVTAVLQREVKQRRDSVEEFTKAGRPDRAAMEEAEITVLQQYLPQQMSPAEVTAVVREAIAASGATSVADIGKVMPRLMGQLKGKAEGRLINQIVRQELGG
jgi:uncharacterized protein YqeY